MTRCEFSHETMTYGPHQEGFFRAELTLVLGQPVRADLELGADEYLQKCFGLLDPVST